MKSVISLKPKGGGTVYNKVTGYLFKSRRYFGPVAPPLIVEDTSRYANHGIFAANHPDWYLEPSGIRSLAYSQVDSDAVALPVTPNLVSPLQFTYKAWIYPTGSTGDAGGSVWGSVIGNAFDASYAAFSDNILRITNGGISHVVLSAATDIWRRWSMFVGTRVGDTWTIWLNTTNMGSNVYAAAILNSSRNLGRGDYGTFNGRIAFPEIANYGWSSDYIYSVFQSERRWFGV